MELTYHKEILPDGTEVQIPDLKAEELPEGEELGKYGFMRQTYLQKHKPNLYTYLELSGTLMTHLLEIQRQAQERVDFLVERMAKAEGVTNELKLEDPMEWVRQMNNIHNRAEESAMEIIYS